ncbi:MAG: hypothetical protein WBD51_12605 [Burkholderiaceae bacterium]
MIPNRYRETQLIAWATEPYYAALGQAEVSNAIVPVRPRRALTVDALLVVKQIDPEYGEPTLNIAVNAVWISALLHG